CPQIAGRSFDCMKNAFTVHPNHWQDLLLATDLNADGAVDLVGRYGTLRAYLNPVRPAHVFRLDLRDASGRRTMYGRAVKAYCQVDGALVGTQFVDGGNGYMAQRSYVLTFRSPWCAS